MRYEGETTLQKVDKTDRRRMSAIAWKYCGPGVDHSHRDVNSATFQVEPENQTEMRDGAPFLKFNVSTPPCHLAMSQQPSRNEKDHVPTEQPQQNECSLWSLVQYECDLSPASIVCKPIYRLMKK